MFPLDLRTIDFPHPYGVYIPQARVEALLEAHAMELGVDIRRGHEVVGLRKDDQGVKAEVRTSSGAYEISALYLVGCDGGHSTVRSQLGVAFPGLEPTIVGRMGDVKLAPGALERLKENLPELGGREFGIARTKAGNFAIAPMESGIYRVAAIEWEQGGIDRDAALSLGELQGAIRRVIGFDLGMSDPVWLSRATDSSRLAEQYRDGRVFLAGDAAHVHWAYGGKGLQTGLQDAGNLGWKLAAEVHGRAPAGLLDTYHTERHPVGQRLMTFTRAQEALARPGEHVTALRELFARLLEDEHTFRTIAEEITDVGICYEMGTEPGEQQPLLGRWAPNLTLHVNDRTIHLADLMRSGRGALIDLTGKSTLHETVSGWTDRVELTVALCYERPLVADAMLVRPDGYVAWVLKSGGADGESGTTLRAALKKWFGDSGNSRWSNGCAAW